MNRPIVNELLCFICQINSPTKEATRGKETFQLCNECASAVEKENNARNRIKKAIYANDTRHMFQYTLGADLTPTQIKIKDRQ